MMPTRARIVRRSIQAAVLCFGAAAGAGEIDAALTLAREGRSEQAEAICSRILAAADAPAVDRAAVDIIRARVNAARARTASDLSAFDKLTDDARGLAERFLAVFSSHALAEEARRAIVDCLLIRAERYARAAREAEGTSAGRDVLRRAQERFADVDTYYRDRRHELEAAAEDAAAAELVEIAVDRARNMLELARLAGLERDTKKRILGEAIEGLTRVQLENFDRAVSFEALWLEGRCREELGDAAGAQHRFEGVLTLVPRLVEAGREPGPYHRGIVRSGYASLGNCLVGAGDWNGAVALVDRAFAEDGALAREPAGMHLMLIKAEALFQSGDTAGAHALARQVIAADAESPHAAAAREKVRAWSDNLRAAGGAPTPERSLITASAAMENEDWLSAVADLRQVVERCETESDRKAYVPEALFKTGQCFAALGRAHEAAFAYERLCGAFPESDVAPVACFEAVRVLWSEFGATKDPHDDARKEVLLARLLASWPDHPAARNVAVLQAEKLEKEARYREAAEQYEKTPPDAQAYEQALVAGARCRYLTAGEGEADAVRTELARAEKALEEFFDRTADPNRTPRSRDLAKQRTALIYLATQQRALVLAHDAVGKHQECVLMLDAFLHELPGGDARRAKILALKVRPLIALERLDEAVAIVDLMLATYPEHAATASVAKAAAIQLERAEGVPRGAEAPETLARIHRYYLQWLRDVAARGVRSSGREAFTIAGTLFSGARRLNGLGEGDAPHLEREAAGVPAPQYFRDVAGVLGTLAEGKLGPLKDAERLAALLDLARCAALTATDFASWKDARERYVQATTAFKLFGEKREIERAALSKHPARLLAAALELAAASFHAARLGNAELYDDAIDILVAVGKVTESGSEPWWRAKHLLLMTMRERASPADMKVTRTLIENLEKNYPTYDDDQYGMRRRILALKATLGAK